MKKRNVLTHGMYTTRALHVVTTNIDPILLVSKVKYFIFYTNFRTTIDRIAEKYGVWIDQSKH